VLSGWRSRAAGELGLLATAHAMSKEKRIFVELVAPPFLAVVWLAVSSIRVEPIHDVVLGFFPLLILAYAFSIVPSLLYALVMEVWFRSGLRARFGCFCTAGFSSLLGAGGGFLACAIGIWLGPLISFDRGHFALIGAVAGLLVGFYVGRKQTSAA
jgi:hypothetical protein